MSALKNFANTLAELHRFLATPVVDERDRAGVIKSFEMTFEQAWKAIQKVTAPLGLKVASPRQAFAVAMQHGWIGIETEDAYLDMIKDRNLAVHTYKESLALEILGRIQQSHLPLFDQLLAQLQKAGDPNSNT